MSSELMRASAIRELVPMLMLFAGCGITGPAEMDLVNLRAGGDPEYRECVHGTGVAAITACERVVSRPMPSTATLQLRFMAMGALEIRGGAALAWTQRLTAAGRGPEALNSLAQAIKLHEQLNALNEQYARDHPPFAKSDSAQRTREKLTRYRKIYEHATRTGLVEL